jgi:hypothetical protein
MCVGPAGRLKIGQQAWHITGSAVRGGEPRRRALGLGPHLTVSLAVASQRVEALHRDIRENRDPLMLKRQEWPGRQPPLPAR